MGGMATDAEPPFSPRFRERYQILGLLGEGGMGSVYRARQIDLDREVAVKVLRSLGNLEQSRFLREARLLSGLEHPGILRVLDFGLDGEVPYLVCEIAPGGTLSEAMPGPARSLREIIELVCAIAEALAFAHQAGVVHRDVKPDNIFVGGAGQPLLADFGLAREDKVGGTLTAAGTIMGTPEYMAPEQVRGARAGAAVDQYALGVILYQMLAGEVPFRGANPMETAMLRLRADPDSLAMRGVVVPEALEGIVLRALARDPEARFPEVTGLHEALQQLLAGGEPELERPVRRRPTRAMPVSAIQDEGSSPAAPTLVPAAPTMGPPRVTARRILPAAQVAPPPLSRARWVIATLGLVALASFFLMRPVTDEPRIHVDHPVDILHEVREARASFRRDLRAAGSLPPDQLEGLRGRARGLLQAVLGQKGLLASPLTPGNAADKLELLQAALEVMDESYELLGREEYQPLADLDQGHTSWLASAIAARACIFLQRGVQGEERRALRERGEGHATGALESFEKETGIDPAHPTRVSLRLELQSIACLELQSWDESGGLPSPATMARAAKILRETLALADTVPVEVIHERTRFQIVRNTRAMADQELNLARERLRPMLQRFDELDRTNRDNNIIGAAGFLDGSFSLERRRFLKKDPAQYEMFCAEARQVHRRVAEALQICARYRSLPVQQFWEAWTANRLIEHLARLGLEAEVQEMVGKAGRGEKRIRSWIEWSVESSAHFELGYTCAVDGKERWTHFNEALECSRRARSRLEDAVKAEGVDPDAAVQIRLLIGWQTLHVLIFHEGGKKLRQHVDLMRKDMQSGIVPGVYRSSFASFRRSPISLTLEDARKKLEDR